MEPSAEVSPCEGDIVFANGAIRLMGPFDSQWPVMAEWLVARNGRVIATGAGTPTCRAPRTVDLHGATVFPGFVDMHAHPAEGGRELHMLDLSAVTSLAELGSAVRAWSLAHPDEPWIEGAGWDAAVLDKLAPLATLDAATDRPVFLSSSDGHSAFVNTAAFRAARLDAAVDPPGGRIDRDASGPTGWIRETAVDRVAEAVPAWDPDRTDAAVSAGLAEFARYGITSIVDANADAESLASYRRLDRAGKLTSETRSGCGAATGHPTSRSLR